jgi:hypothetical protein
MALQTNTALAEKEDAEEAPISALPRQFKLLTFEKRLPAKAAPARLDHWEVDADEPSKAAAPAPKTNGLRYISKLASPLTFVVLFGLWQILTALAVYPEYILPAPATVAERWLETAQTGMLWKHSQVTQR